MTYILEGIIKMNSPYTFKHIAPTATTNNQKPGAIFLLHGLGSNEEDLLQLVQEFKGQCHIFSLRGPITHRPGYAFYTFEEEGKPNREVFDKMIMITQSFILEAIEQYNLNIEKIYVVGFNQGAAVAQTLLVSMGSIIRGVASLSGFLPEFVKDEYRKRPLDHAKIFISHGEYDYVYPIGWSKVSEEFFKEQGAQVIYSTYSDGHGVSPENLQDLVQFIAEDLVETTN